MDFWIIHTLWSRLHFEHAVFLMQICFDIPDLSHMPNGNLERPVQNITDVIYVDVSVDIFDVVDLVRKPMPCVFFNPTGNHALHQDCQ